MHDLPVIIGQPIERLLYSDFAQHEITRGGEGRRGVRPPGRALLPAAEAKRLIPDDPEDPRRDGRPAGKSLGTIPDGDHRLLTDLLSEVPISEEGQGVAEDVIRESLIKAAKRRFVPLCDPVEEILIVQFAPSGRQRRMTLPFAHETVRRTP